MEALMAGYEGARPLSDAEREAMPMLLRGAALRFLLTRLYDFLISLRCGGEGERPVGIFAQASVLHF